MPRGAPTACRTVPVIAFPNDLMPDHDALAQRIAELQLEHRDLDAVIDMLAQQPSPDELRLRRLKKRKLQIKDTIVLLQMRLTPDILA